ncbi:hypothetical protein ABLE68_02665 [Nocardioides sp. CN2-186]|uniref:hypothetical protein n=1 Tax=Nocardioides tweenelious TaxID=3156607 RepID=UPI0032B467D8
MKVTSPDGQTWRISRRWFPWRRRVRDILRWLPGSYYGNWGDGALGAFLGLLSLILVIPFLVLLVVAGIEMALVLAVLPFALLGRVLLGRHWTVEVRRGRKPWTEEKAGDWQASDLRIHEVADEIRGGSVPEQTLNLKKVKKEQPVDQVA